jgi:hypothetical protein
MKKVIALAALLILGCFAPRAAMAQAAIAVPSCGSTTVQTGINGLNQPLQINAQGYLCASAGTGGAAPGAPGYAATDLGYTLITPTTATAPTIPGTALFCTFQAQGQIVNYRADGTAPTATTGNQLFPGGVLTGYGQTYLTGLRFIQTATGGTVAQECFK